jgi:glucose/arabinose dehydrogenase
VNLTAAAVIAGAVAVASGIVLASGPPAAELKSYHFTVKDLAEPSTSAPNPPKIVPRPEGAMLTMPPGFQAEIFAENFKRPRIAVEAPNGDIFVADPSIGTVLVLHDSDGNRVIDAAERSEFATGLNAPFGMAFHGGHIYVAAADAVLRFPYTSGQLKATVPGERIADLPHGPTGHSTRNIRFSPDGAWFYVTVGSSSNIDVDPDPQRAAVLRFRADGSGREVVVTGTVILLVSTSTPRHTNRGSPCRNGTASVRTWYRTTWPARATGRSLAGPTLTSAPTRIPGTRARDPTW